MPLAHHPYHLDNPYHPNHRVALYPRTQLIDVSAILNSIMSLLPDPNPNSPANQEAARLYRTDAREYERRVKEMVRLTWKEEAKRWHA